MAARGVAHHTARCQKWSAKSPMPLRYTFGAERKTASTSARVARPGTVIGSPGCVAARRRHSPTRPRR